MKGQSLKVIFTIIIVVLLVGIAYTAIARRGGLSIGGVIKDSGDNISDYSAVFLTNDQVYFGKVNKKNSDEVVLSDIYYLKVNQNIQSQEKTSDTTQQPNIVLVKLGEELHGPNDVMHINKDQLLFIESLKSDSKVVKAIDENKSK